MTAAGITLILLFLVGIGPVAYGQQESPDEKHATPDNKQQQENQKRQQRQEDQQRRAQEQEKQRALQQQQQRQAEENREEQQRRAQQKQHERDERLSQQRQRQLIEQQQQRLAQYRQSLDAQARRLQEDTARLEQQRRIAQYRFQQDYLEHIREQERRLREERHDYYSDPYFYTPPAYRYYRGGRYYETNQFGADLLRKAVNDGYQEGFRAGAADREDHWRPDYRDSYAYRDATYGYSGYYLDPEDYRHYFREGFRRGYEDGYNDTSEYGYSSGGGSYGILAEVLSLILNLQPLNG
jgi:hypothetical protein